MESENGASQEAREIEARLTEFIQRELLSQTGTTVGREEDLLSGELLDSVAVLRLAAFVEAEFQITMQPADFVISNFQNVAVLGAYVDRCRQRAS